jgi:hypothetical protein
MSYRDDWQKSEYISIGPTRQDGLENHLHSPWWIFVGFGQKTRKLVEPLGTGSGAFQWCDFFKDTYLVFPIFVSVKCSLFGAEVPWCLLHIPIVTRNSLVKIIAWQRNPPNMATDHPWGFPAT